MAKPSARPGISDLKMILKQYRGAFLSVGAFSFVINLLMLTGPIFMLQVYDRVLTSRSLQTLIALIILVAVLYLFMGGLDYIRGRVLTRIGLGLEQGLSGRAFDLWVRQGLQAGMQAEQMNPAQDLATIRQFLASPAITALFDSPWVPLYLALVAILHPMLGLVALAGAVVSLVLALANEYAARELVGQSAKASAVAGAFGGQSFRNAEAVTAMGMQKDVEAKWQGLANQAGTLSMQATDRTAMFAISTRTIRMFLQSLILAVGAYLVIQNEITPGTMIASSIIMGRALAPVDQIVGLWRNFIQARLAYTRLDRLMQLVPAEPERMALPRPSGHVIAENLSYVKKGVSQPILEGLNFALEPGEALGLIGPSAAGKSTLARMLVGLLPAQRGTIRLGGAAISQWTGAQGGQHIGYVPQDVELFAGSVKDNIARFQEGATHEDIVAAAQKAGAHKMILALPHGYDTPIGADGALLSGGQRQRIALARAFFGDPVLLVLDEPNANLDEEGDAALLQALQTHKQAGGVVVIVTHKRGTLDALDKLLVLKDGRMVVFGPRDQVMAHMAGQQQKSLENKAGKQDASARTINGNTSPATGASRETAKSAPHSKAGGDVKKRTEQRAGQISPRKKPAFKPLSDKPKRDSSHKRKGLALKTTVRRGAANDVPDEQKD